MVKDNSRLYTSGVFARKAGVSLRTIQYYDRVNILKPTSYSSSGMRLYNDSDFEKLQRILTLKFLGFSLEEIRKLILEDTSDNISWRLNEQKNALIDRMENMKMVIEAIESVKNTLEDNREIEWERFIDIITALSNEKVLKDQYKNANNLRARINLHALFSTSKIGWFHWLNDIMDFKSNSRILEIGCGDASFWKANIDRIPKDCSILLTDKSEGMLDDAIKNLGTNSSIFEFKQMEAEKIDLDNEKFDVVIANHVLFYVKDRRSVLSEIRRVMKPGAKLVASTIGKNHLKELHELLKSFSSILSLSERIYQEDFGLENGEAQLKELFEDIQRFIFEDSLVVTQASYLVDYVMSTSGNIHSVLHGTKYNEFCNLIEKMVKRNGSIYITKESGVFTAWKQN